MSFSRMLEYLQVKNKGKIVKEQRLILIPKTEKYIEYMLNIILKLPRTEKYSMGTEYKTSMYKMLEDILIISKVNNKEVIFYLNKIDARLNVQRIYLRIMKKEKWIDIKKFNVAIEQIYEIGKILGGLIKYYAKDYKK